MFTYSSVCRVLLTSSGVIDDFVSGRIKYLRIDHQSFDESVLEESLSASFSLNDCFVSRVSFTTLLHIS